MDKITLQKKIETAIRPVNSYKTSVRLDKNIKSAFGNAQLAAPLPFANTAGEFNVLDQNNVFDPAGVVNYASTDPISDGGFDNIGVLTVEAWVKLFATSLYYPSVAGSNEYVNPSIVSRGTGQFGLQFLQDTDRPEFILNRGGSPLVYRATTSFPLNVWTHLAVTWSESEERARFYFNGALVDNIFAGRIPPLNNTTNPIILGGPGSYGDPFPGLLDEVRIWNVQRTAQQIADNYEVQIAPQANLLAYYDFNEKSGDVPGVINDRSGNGFHANIFGEVALSTDAPDIPELVI